MRALTVGLALAALSTLACNQAGPEATLSSSSALSREARAAPAERDGGFRFQKLVGVPRPFTGAANAIRGVPGGGRPWAILGEGSARLDDESVLHVKVRGLVFDPNDAANVAAGLAGTNTVPLLKAIVSCLTVQDGNAVTVNFSTAPVPFSLGAAADGGGNADIEEAVTLPSPCLAPIVFATSAAGAWFATGGQ
jgi:hypothetical protein